MIAKADQARAAAVHQRREAQSNAIDITPSRCNDGSMRTTIDLPSDLHNAVTSIAAHARKSMNQTVAELIRRGLAHPPMATDAALNQGMRIDKRTGLPVIRSPRPVTAEDVRALEDE